MDQNIEKVAEITENRESAHPRRHIVLAFFLLLIPLLGISLVLVIFVFYKEFHDIFPNKGTDTLPTPYPNVTRDAYYTNISIGKVTLASSWASTAVQFVLAPFMFLFSFVVAREFSQAGYHDLNTDGVNSWACKAQDNFKGLLKGSYQDIFDWIYYKHLRTPKDGQFKPARVAAVGALISFTLG